MGGFGALGTIFLALLTYLTLRDNQKLVHEELKDREKPIWNAVLRDIVNASLQSISSNGSVISNAEVEWTETKSKQSPTDLTGTGLNTCLDNPDLVAVEYFWQSYPEASRLVSQYDQRLHEMTDTARDVLERLEDPVTDFRLNTRGITEHDHDRLLSLLIAGPEATSSEELPEWWVENEGAIQSELIDNIPELQAWYDDLEEFLTFSERLQEQLRHAKRDIQSEYGIDPDSGLQ
ncbi:hypothetical protein [Salinigranum halophilum]|jgi:hypothetical protein|uniref:hypothetical protein n=1 Tax=Salinigranum halophilum TaxID=2565931 RepID=UPI0010A92AC9|nr:hypothetical protein [Salinigranum halophilum]